MTGTGDVTGITGTKMNITSKCNTDSSSGFEFRVAILIVWLQNMATVARQPFYLPSWIFFLNLDFPSLRQVATHCYKTK